MISLESRTCSLTMSFARTGELAPLILLLLFGVQWLPAACHGQDPTWHAPSGLVFSESGRELFVACRDTATLRRIDVGSRDVVEVVACAGRPVDIARVGQHLFVLDQARHELCVIDISSRESRTCKRIELPRYPTRVLASRNGSTLWITSLWSRKVTRFGLDANGELLKSQMLDLPFCPQEMVEMPDGKLVIASAFNGQLAVLDDVRIQSIHKIRGHNIDGIAVHEDKLLLAMQVLNPIAHSTRDDIHWGNLMSNALVAFPISALHQGKLDARREELALGEPNHGSGDPGRILGVGEKILVLLAGAGQIAIVDTETGSVRRLPVGHHPVAVASAGSLVAIANQHSNSVSLTDFAKGPDALPIEISLSLEQGSRASQVQRGEALFFSSRLSHDGWMSCHSCHSDGHSPDLNNDNLSDGSFGTPKRIPSLLGVAETGPWSWLGEVHSLAEQVRTSVEITMRGQDLSETDIQDLVAYMRTLQQPEITPPLPDKQKIRAGKRIFRELRCSDCHEEPHFTSDRRVDVGLADERGRRKFNPPSLLGLRFRDAYFHDGRANTLDEVFTKHRHQLDVPLADEDLTALLQFLNSI